MKLLLDACVSGKLTEKLAAAGHEVVHVRDIEQLRWDEDILAFAHDNEMVLVTLDSDFGRLAVLQELPHHGIVRLKDMSTTSQFDALKESLRLHAEDLARGALLTVGPTSMRLRSPGPGKEQK